MLLYISNAQFMARIVDDQRHLDRRFVKQVLLAHPAHYDDLMSDVSAFLEERIAACEAAGIDKSQLNNGPLR